MVVKFGKKELSAVGAICYIVGALLLFVILPNQRGLDLLIYVLAQLVCSLGMGIYSTVSWAMMGDAIDYNEWKFGTREEGVVYSLHSFFRKLAQGIGPAVALLIMQGLGYINNAILNPKYDEDVEGSIQYFACSPEDCTAVNPKWLGDDVVISLRTLVSCSACLAANSSFILAKVFLSKL